MKVVVATGGTGGHIFPALQTACVLRDRGHEVVFIGVLGFGEEKLKAQGFKTINIHAAGLTDRSLTGMIKFGWLMLGAIVRSRKTLKQIRPDKVIGFGGYGSFAIVLAAKDLNIPTMIHEQNAVPGKANRFLSGLVRKVAISFPEAGKYFNPSKTIWTGCPCHQKRPLESKEALIKKFSLALDRKTILLLGGSQGSQRLNEVFYQMIAFWTKEHQNIQVIHMTGKKEYSQYLDKYQKVSLPVKVFDFITPIEEVYAIADCVIARSGAATVSELGFFAIPSILVPYPLADGHQKYNAQVLSKLGLASIIDQKDLTKEVLQDAVSKVLSTDLNREECQTKIKDSFKDLPAFELAKVIEDL